MQIHYALTRKVVDTQEQAFRTQDGEIINVAEPTGQ